MSKTDEQGLLEAAEKALLRHVARYPLMQPQDAVKLLYQSEFGSGHMVADPAENLQRLRQECPTTGQDESAPLFEEIGGGFCRINLRVSGAEEAVVAAIHRMFIAGANNPCGSMQGFEQKLELLRELAEMERLPFSLASLESYLESYRRQGMPAVSHSHEYHQAYSPAYRVVPSVYRTGFALICGVEQLLAQKQRVTLALDGLCGSGKTTLAAQLAALYDCNIIEMDDFFLPPEKRTPQRLAEPGGNVDYERFCDEVVPHLGGGQPFEYRVFDCSVMGFTQNKSITPKALTICEGSYSQHPCFGSPYDIKAFVTCSAQEQQRRLLARSGPEFYQRFAEEWIPMEQAYFKACQTRGQSHFVIDTTGS